MTIRIEVETFSNRNQERTFVTFTDDEKLAMGYWQIEIIAETNGKTFYSVKHDGWVEWEAQIDTGTGRAYVFHGKSRALPPFLRSHLPEILRKLSAGNVERFEADPPPYWVH